MVVLIGPLFRVKYFDKWPSIESTFISDARMLAEHPHAGWQPLWYCGTRMDYIYPPGLRYGTVLIARVSHAIPARAYHLYVGAFYVLGIVAVYWLVRVGSGSRGAAWLASAGTALLSPAFLFLPQVRADSAFLVPWRLHVLMQYGEGPHISALCLLPLALVASFAALRDKSRGALAAAPLLCALVVANNFYGAVALAVFYPVLVWSVWLAHGGRTLWRRAASIPLLTLGLSAFWLTPSYVKITLVDLRWVSQPASTLSRLSLLGAIIVYGILSLRLCRRRPERSWAAFVGGTTVIFGVLVSSAWLGLAAVGDAKRLVPELDLALTLAGVEAMRTLWQRRRFRRVTAAIAVIAFSFSGSYIRHAWTPFAKSKPIESVYEYDAARWVAENLPGARVLPSGSVRLWFDAWADNPQTDGGSLQGMTNQLIPDAIWQIQHGERADLAALWMQALGTDAVIVGGKKSLDTYHDYAHEEKFRGRLPVIHDDGQGTVIYRVPRVHAGLARVVNTAAINSTKKIRGGADDVGLMKYVAVIEDPAQNDATLRWSGFDAADIETKTSSGQSILVQETWDPGWHAYESGRALGVRKDETMGFMLIDGPAGDRKVQLRFEKPLENRAGQVISLITIAVLIGLVLKFRYKHRVV
jgi:hypothetical protein